MLGKNAANPLRICEYFNETEPRSAPSKSGSDTHALLRHKTKEILYVFPSILTKDERKSAYPKRLRV